MDSLNAYYDVVLKEARLGRLGIHSGFRFVRLEVVDEEALDRYGDQVDYYLKVPPGMTGLLQISGRTDTE